MKGSGEDAGNKTKNEKRRSKTERYWKADKPDEGKDLIDQDEGREEKNNDVEEYQVDPEALQKYRRGKSVNIKVLCLFIIPSTYSISLLVLQFFIQC